MDSRGKCIILESFGSCLTNVHALDRGPQPALVDPSEVPNCGSGGGVHDCPRLKKGVVDKMRALVPPQEVHNSGVLVTEKQSKILLSTLSTTF